MNMNLTIPNAARAGAATRILAALILVTASSLCDAASASSQASNADGWQTLSSESAAKPASVPATPLSASSAPDVPLASQGATPQSMSVAAVVLPGSPSAPTGTLTLTITPQDINLRNALDRWLQTQGWQLAWKIDDDLPLEFNATFTGDFTSVLTQLMKATNHMRTPTRICRHTNNVIRVIARAANCQD